MVSIFVDYYLEGMLAGAAVILAVGGLCLIVYIKEKNRKHCPSSPDYWKPKKTVNMAKRAVLEAGFYIGASLILITVLYAWITPIASYSGVVEDRYTRQNFRKWPRTNHYLIVNGIRRSVDENIYERAAIGDTIVHPIGQQRYSINRTFYMAESCAWNTGFWAGMVLASCLFLCGGAFYQRFHGLKQKNIMKH
jgi:hypothetical protein